MTNPQWPTSLANKKFSTSGYTEDVYSDPTIRTDVDSGPPKMRPRFTAVPGKIDGQIDTLSSAECDDLITFWRTNCALGSIAFDWVHPRSGAAATYMWLKYPTIEPTDGSPICFTATLSFVLMP